MASPGGDAGTSRRASLAHLQQLYDRNRFIEGYRRTYELWSPSTGLDSLSTDEIVLGARLAVRLGGGRLSRWLLRTAAKRDPGNPRVRYFARNSVTRYRRVLDELRDYERSPDLGGDDVEMRASFFASQACTWAALRHFDRAFESLERARSLRVQDSWVLSCEAYVLGEADRWADALEAAERAFEISAAPYAVKNLGMALVNLGRAQEAAERTAAAADGCESYEIAIAACWHMCAWAETQDGGTRASVLGRARDLTELAARLAPLSDRDTRAIFARMQLDIADLGDDHAAMEKWSSEVRSPFHRRMLANLRQNPNGARLRLPYRREIQKHETCLPASLASALAAQGIQISADEMAAEITFGGTWGWAAAEWLEKRGLVVRFFAVEAGLAVRLIERGIAFVATWEGDDFAHAVAIVGVDQAAGTLLVHDPQSFREHEYLLEGIGRGQGPWGPKGMVVVPADRRALLDELLPVDAGLLEASQAQHKAIVLGGPSAGRPVVAEAARQHPEHPGTRLMQAIQDEEDGRIGQALSGYQAVLNQFPDSASVRLRLLSACRSLGNSALMRQTLKEVVERGILPGIHSQQEWDYPPARYVCEYADLLRLSAATRKEARALLESVLRRQPNAGEVWHVLGDLLWAERDIEGGLLAYRLACCNVVHNEHYARTYCDALASQRCEREGLAFLEARARTEGGPAHAVATWVNWINALEDFGHPEQALSACEEALERHPSSPELLEFVVPFLARMGLWEKAEEMLARLQAGSNAASFHEAAAQFQNMRGVLDDAVMHAEAWAVLLPRYMGARYMLLELLARRDGIEAAVERAAEWCATHPGHDDLEEAYCRQLERSNSDPHEMYALLRRRVKRNAEDAWAWRQLGFVSIGMYERSDGRRQVKLARRIGHFLTQSDRTSAEDAATLRARAAWHEARGDWTEAVASWLEAAEREPGSGFSYRRAWDCAATLGPQGWREVQERLETVMLAYPGRLTVAGEMAPLLAWRLGVAEAEQAIARWREQRPDDPEIVEAAADLLVDHGHGRSDAERAVALLEPAVAHFPYHFGLRISLASAHRASGRIGEAEQDLQEAIRRHPANSSALLRLIWMRDREKDQEDVDRLLEEALRRDPRNPQIWDARANVLMNRGRIEEAVALVEAGLKLMPDSVPWRDSAITLLGRCGALERTVEVAREGTRVYPEGAYMWLMLGRTLNELRRYAAPGEIEKALRRSVTLNATLFDAVDLLSCYFVEQRAYEEAAEAMKRIERRMPDPSPARGRLAWIKRQQGLKKEALEDMAGAVAAAPWYRWGWGQVMQWLREDQEWERARALLGTVPPQMRTDTDFRVQRLGLLQEAGLESALVDAEWEELLRDFPEECPLHLRRYDTLHDAGRHAEAAAVLAAIQPLYADNAYVQARQAEVLLAGDQREEAFEAALSVWFAPVDAASPWPSEKVWELMANAKLAGELYARARRRLERRDRPTRAAFGLMASHAATVPDPQPWLLRFVRPRPEAELLALLDLADRSEWGDGRARADVLLKLGEQKHNQAVLQYWKKSRAKVEEDADCWAQVGRAYHNMGRTRAARKFLSSWRTRRGVGMWVVANYVMLLSRSRRDLREALECCRDALSGLPHDHCARFLAYVQAECCALLGDPAALLETWNTHRAYFDGNVQEGEWFEEKRRDLLGDIPVLVRWLEQGETRLYRRKVRKMRWAEFLKWPE